MIFHPFHLVTQSPWPLVSSFTVLVWIGGVLKLFFFFETDMFLIGFMAVILGMMFWWQDMVREGTYLGQHTFQVVSGLKKGMVLFILSEVFFFFSFFWAFFHSSLSPVVQVGEVWPCMNIKVFNVYEIPLLNSIVLLSSGSSVTWAHFCLLEGKELEMKLSMLLTIGLGLYFTILQSFEYYEASFTLADSVYGSVFFVLTGFHGLHVIIGSTFLLVMVGRMFSVHFSSSHHFGFEAAAWYWHFVDVVWLFLFVSIYWWGGI